MRIALVAFVMSVLFQVQASQVNHYSYFDCYRALKEVYAKKPPGFDERVTEDGLIVIRVPNTNDYYFRDHIQIYRQSLAPKHTYEYRLEYGHRFWDGNQRYQRELAYHYEITLLGHPIKRISTFVDSEYIGISNFDNRVLECNNLMTCERVEPKILRNAREIEAADAVMNEDLKTSISSLVPRWRSMPFKSAEYRSKVEGALSVCEDIPALQTMVREQISQFRSASVAGFY